MESIHAKIELDNTKLVYGNELKVVRVIGRI